MTTTSDICSQLKKTYRVDEFFYPNISMDIEMPNGLEGEVGGIIKALSNLGYEVNVANVFQVMNLKRSFLLKYAADEEGKKLIASYRELLTTRVKPVGSAIPVELLFVDGLVVILLSVIARFGVSFADEAGKILARKLLGSDRREAKKHNMTAHEYRFVKNEALILVEEGKTIKSFARKMQIKRRQNRIKKRSRKTKE